MIINVQQIKELLENENISTNQIQNITGFNRKNVWMYRTGRTQLMKMQLQTLIKLQECYDLTHDTLMKYKNFNEVIESFNNRYSQTEIYLSPQNELKLLYDGILGDIKKDDIKVYDKNMSEKIDRTLLQQALESIEWLYQSLFFI